MSRFQILCATMHQSDFSKIKEMNISCDVLFANQCDVNQVDEYRWNGHTAKMISTNTRGVGKNRNIALIYADSDYCLFADDDCEYYDDVEEKVTDEFERFPDTDIIIFNVESSDSVRRQKVINTTRALSRFEPRPWGAVRIAFKLDSIRKENLWFTTLFGGGSIYANGEDSLWLNDAFKKRLKILKSNKYIGKVNFDQSSWFDGYNEKFYFSKGAYYAAAHKYTYRLWELYFSLRTSSRSKLRFLETMKWMKNGHKSFKKLVSYDEYILNEK